MNLLDTRKQIVLDIKKKNNLEHVKAQVVLALDFSGSMGHLYTSGQVQELVERILPLGLAFDDNGEVDFYLFHDSFIKLPDNITRENVMGYITNKVMAKGYNMGGTDYAPIINKIVEDYGGKVGEKKGMFGGFFSKKEENVKPFKYPVYVLFITDGETNNKQGVEAAIINASKYGIFFQFVGIGSASFAFLEKLDNLSGRTLDNANFFKVQNVGAKTDEDLYSLLLNEFPSWIPQARNAKQIE